MSLRFLYLIFGRILAWLVLLGRGSSSKGVELPASLPASELLRRTIRPDRQKPNSPTAS
ncbi:MAG: hypothetical protein LH603_05760 [Pseudonocardia sp.]|nr:hypothetical protein [Pseudonocardia sp.]